MLGIQQRLLVKFHELLLDSCLRCYESNKKQLPCYINVTVVFLLFNGCNIFFSFCIYYCVTFSTDPHDFYKSYVKRTIKMKLLL